MRSLSSRFYIYDAYQKARSDDICQEPKRIDVFTDDQIAYFIKLSSLDSLHMSEFGMYSAC